MTLWPKPRLGAWPKPRLGQHRQIPTSPCPRSTTAKRNDLKRRHDALSTAECRWAPLVDQPARLYRRRCGPRPEVAAPAAQTKRSGIICGARLERIDDLFHGRLAQDGHVGPVLA